MSINEIFECGCKPDKKNNDCKELNKQMYLFIIRAFANFQIAVLVFTLSYYFSDTLNTAIFIAAGVFYLLWIECFISHRQYVNLVIFIPIIFIANLISYKYFGLANGILITFTMLLVVTALGTLALYYSEEHRIQLEDLEGRG